VLAALVLPSGDRHAPGPRGATDLPTGSVAFRDGRVAVPGADLHYVRGGHGPGVVLLPGFPETWYAWRKVMGALARRYTVVAVDPPGVGASSPARGSASARATAARIAALVERLGLRRVTVVGHDLGGWTAYALARFHPSLVTRLAVLGAGLPGWGLERRRDFSRRPRPGNDLVARYLGPDRQPAATFDGGALAEYLRAYSRPGRLRAALRPYRAFAADVAANRGGRRLTLPVLVLDADTAEGRADATDVRRAAWRVEGGVVPGASHYLPEERPRLVVDRLLSFLSR